MLNSRNRVADHLRSTPLALGDGFGGPSVTASRYGHCHPSLIITGPRSGGRTRKATVRYELTGPGIHWQRNIAPHIVHG